MTTLLAPLSTTKLALMTPSIIAGTNSTPFCRRSGISSVPAVRGEILPGALAERRTKARASLRRTLVGRESIKPSCFADVPRHATPLFVHRAEHKLTKGVVLIGRQLVQPHGLGVALGQAANAVGVTGAKNDFGNRIALGSGEPREPDSLVVVARRPRSNRARRGWPAPSCCRGWQRDCSAVPLRPCSSVHPAPCDRGRRDRSAPPGRLCLQAP
jgi:hypothetical protein